MALFKKKNSKQSEAEKENEMKKNNKKQEEKRIKRLEKLVKKAKESSGNIEFETDDLDEKDRILEIMSKCTEFQCAEDGAKVKNGKVKYVLNFIKKKDEEDEDLY